MSAATKKYQEDVLRIRVPANLPKHLHPAWRRGKYALDSAHRQQDAENNSTTGSLSSREVAQHFALTLEAQAQAIQGAAGSSENGMPLEPLGLDAASRLAVTREVEALAKAVSEENIRRQAGEPPRELRNHDPNSRSVSMKSVIDSLDSVDAWLSNSARGRQARREMANAVFEQSGAGEWWGIPPGPSQDFYRRHGKGMFLPIQPSSGPLSVPPPGAITVVR